jgi:tRNA (adenine57-N1/adenine58-N1)-methyltransferase
MIGPGKRVLLKGKDREYFVLAGPGTLSTDKGMIDLETVAAAEPGQVITTHTGNDFTAILPRAPDFFAHARRSGAPMLPKDIGLVIAYTGMNRNDRVLDAGTGSGIAAIYFGGIAHDVVTYEARPEFAAIAEKNIREAGLGNVTVISGDVLSADGMYDIVHYDMTIGPEHVRHAHTLIRPGGFLACYTPFLEYLIGVMDEAALLYSEVMAVECIEREMTRTKRGTRPSTRVGHSGYITIARK